MKLFISCTLDNGVWWKRKMLRVRRAYPQFKDCLASDRFRKEAQSVRKDASKKSARWLSKEAEDLVQSLLESIVRMNWFSCHYCRNLPCWLLILEIFLQGPARAVWTLEQRRGMRGVLGISPVYQAFWVLSTHSLALTALRLLLETRKNFKVFPDHFLGKKSSVCLAHCALSTLFEPVVFWCFSPKKSIFSIFFTDMAAFLTLKNRNEQLEMPREKLNFSNRVR